MIANYHTHTPRCGHATGTEEDYIRTALAAGYHTLGFSDHTPYLFPDGYVSTFRMRPTQLQDYVDTIFDLRQKYADKIQLPLGVEAEFYPKFFADTVVFLRDHGIEYMLLAQHLLENEVERVGAVGPTADPEQLRKYCNQSIDAMHTGLFSCFAHPDLMNFVGEAKIYRQEIGRLCRAAKACNLPLEFNLLGLRENKHYPNPLFWQIVAEEGCNVVLGRDAHQPEMLADPVPEEKGRAIIEGLGLTILEEIPLVRI